MRITIVPYSLDWPSLFEKEAKHLHAVLGNLSHEIHHIGSTSVPGLKAKPIIDILMDVSSLEQLDLKTQDFEQIGYEVMGEYGISGRRYFRKGGDHRTHHVHAFQSGDPHIIRHLAFRDYLRKNPTVADEYGQLKWEIAQSCGHDIGTYGDRKDPFIKLHEARALTWHAQQSEE